jgi:hypothetical protein
MSEPLTAENLVAPNPSDYGLTKYGPSEWRWDVKDAHRALEFFIAQRWYESQLSAARITSLQSSLDLTQEALGVATETIASLKRENAALKREHDELRHAIRSTARLVAAARSLDDAFAEFGPDPELIHEHATELCAAIEAYDESMAEALRPAPAPAEQAQATASDDVVEVLRSLLDQCRPYVVQCDREGPHAHPRLLLNMIDNVGRIAPTKESGL